MDIAGLKILYEMMERDQAKLPLMLFLQVSSCSYMQYVVINSPIAIWKANVWTPFPQTFLPLPSLPSHHSPYLSSLTPLLSSPHSPTCPSPRSPYLSSLTPLPAPPLTPPTIFPQSLHDAMPQFAERDEKTGAYQQQDAHECWSGLVSNLGQVLKMAADPLMVRVSPPSGHLPYLLFAVYPHRELVANRGSWNSISVSCAIEYLSPS